VAVGKGATGALALILLWVAFAAFFVAFHPGGIRDDLFKSSSNPQGNARNPRDVLLWLIKRATTGPAQASDSSSTQQGDIGAGAGANVTAV
jgi:hypothetical protein